VITNRQLEYSPIFVTIAPTEWLPAPEWMNVHYLLRAERCPRSAALRYANYEALWSRNGYPDKPSVAAASGIVIHTAVGKIATSLAKAGCMSSSDPRFCAILKQLGGYSAVIGAAISELETTLNANPRFTPMRESFIASLRKRLPQVRESIQMQLARLTWVAHPSASATPAKGGTQSVRRLPLPPGVHFEVELRDKTLKWRGIADLIELRASSCDITDFKSGVPSDDHLFQLRVYALLWLRDSEVNPRGIAVNRLTVSYPTEDRALTFSQPEQSSFSSALQSRTDSVRAAITGATSKAVLSTEVCPHCDVRLLCSEYWTTLRPSTPTFGAQDDHFDDVQLVLTSRKGENTWLAEVQIASHLEPAAQILLRWTLDEYRILEQLRPGTIIRLAGALLSEGHDESSILTCVATTDLLVVKQ
jgi:hypothetical protein